MDFKGTFILTTPLAFSGQRYRYWSGAGHQERFYCPKNCGKVYKNKKSAWNHIRYECGMECQFHCDFCGKRFSQKSSLKTHLGLIHKVFVV